MKPKKAQSIQFFLCDTCAAVHIGLWRNGQMFAEAIPADIDAVATELQAAIDDSRRRRKAAALN